MTAANNSASSLRSLLKIVCASVFSVLMIFIIIRFGKQWLFLKNFSLNAELWYLVAIISVVILWITYILWNIIKYYQNKIPYIQHPRIAHEQVLLQDLKEHFQIVYNYLRKKCRKNLFQTKTLPWILLIGASQSGKTSLLGHAEITVDSPLQHSLQKIKNTQFVDWWINKDAVFIDPAGKYSLPKNDDLTAQLIWQNLLQMSKQSSKESLINGVVLVIDFPTLGQADDAAFTALIERFTHQLQILKMLNKKLFVNLVITHCDRIIGFNEFFDDLDKEERNQRFGFVLGSQLDATHAETLEPKDLIEEFETQFQIFLKQISSRLIWRLHHENNLHKRTRIKEYPLQLEKLGERLEAFISQLPWNHQIRIEGVYFVSSLQKGVTIDLLFSRSLRETFNLVPMNHNNTSTQQKSFFIKHTIQYLIKQSSLLPEIPAQKIWRKLITYPVTIAMIGVLALMWHQGYYNLIQTLQEITITLKTPPNVYKNIPDWLTQLNVLDDALNTIEQNHSLWFRWIGFQQIKKIHSNIEANYQQLLIHSFLPYLKRSITTELQQGMRQNDTSLYNELKTYLMFSDPKHFNTTFIKLWYHQLWSSSYQKQPKIQKQLAKHLDHLFALTHPQWTADFQLIKQVRQELNSLPLADITFMKLQEVYSPEYISILPRVDNFANLDLNSARIPAYCATNQFEKVYNESIIQLAKNTQEKNWVLNNTNTSVLSEKQQIELIQQVRHLYVKYYEKQWMNVIDKIHLVTPDDIAATQKSIQLLLDNQSDLWKVLNIIIENATLNNQPTETNSNNNYEQLNAIKNYMHHTGNIYQQTQTTLNQLSSFLANIKQSNQIDKSSYQTAKERVLKINSQDPITDLLQLADHAPAPFQSWFTSIADGAWQTILNHSKQYLNTIWISMVIPEYNQSIKNRYPIFTDAGQDIVLSDFNHFFGPNGTVGNFFNLYLKPFVNMDKTYWTWKEVDNQTLPISQKFLEMMIRASMIQQMFFSDNSQSAQINFTLKPISLSENISSLTLNLGGQILQYNADNAAGATLQWPIANAYFATLLFDGKDGHTPSITTNGPWAWYHLLDKAKLESTYNANQYQLTFQVANYSVDYLLITDHLVNPYIPGILHSFRCDEKL